MRNLKKNEQQMYYALLIGEEPIYELDEDGNRKIDFVDEDGNTHYLETGEKRLVYSAPVPFRNGISGKLSEVLVKEFGIDDTSMYAEMDAEANKYPIATESLIWRGNESFPYPSLVVFPSNELFPADGTIDKTSCDYVVAGVLNEGLNVWNYLLRRNLK